MSGADQDLDMLAAEFVLGTLDPSEAGAVAARRIAEPALDQAIAAWEQRIAPLVLLVQPVTPPPGLWARLAASTGQPVTPPQAGAPEAAIVVRLRRSVAVWRGAAAVGFALAAGLAAFAVLNRAPPPQPGPVAALVPQGGAPAVFVAEARPDGSIRIVQLSDVTVAQGKDLELWALPAGATRPVSLGVVQATRTPPEARPVSGTQLLVSLEPKGGSPTGQPTGPVLYGGVLKAN